MKATIELLKKQHHVLVEMIHWLDSNKPAEILLTMKKNNKLGKKTGEGFYNYEF